MVRSSFSSAKDRKGQSEWGVGRRLTEMPGVGDSLLTHMSQEAGGKAEAIMFSVRTSHTALSARHQDQR